MFSFRKKNEDTSSKAVLEALDETQLIAEFAADGTLLKANDKFLQMMGCEKGDLLGKNHSIFVSDAKGEAERQAELWHKLRAGRFDLGECLRTTPNGREVWLQAAYHPIRDKEGRVHRVLMIATDITISKKRTLDDASQIAAIGNAHAVIEFDIDGRILTANDTFLNLMGYGLNDIAGKHHSIFVQADQREGSDYKEFWRLLRHGKHMTGEYKRITSQAKEVWIFGSYTPVLDERGRVLKVVKSATDITDQKMKMADLAGQIDAINKSQAVIQFDMDGKILSANENFLSVLGYRLPEIIGRHHRIFLSEEDANGRAYAAFWASLKAGIYQAAEYRRLRKDGVSVWIQASYNPVLDLNGHPFKIVKYATDTTRQVLLRMGNERVCKMMESVAAGAEELNASVCEISEAMAKSRQTAEAAVHHVESADAKARQFSEAAGSMEGIVGLIGHITGQINLLALNATIESARAGEAGRGFAVVASEVKNLATQARHATEKISGEIGNLNAISSDVVEALIGIKTAIQNVSEYVTTTAAAVEEQSVVTSEMSASMQRAASEAAAMAVG